MAWEQSQRFTQKNSRPPCAAVSRGWAPPLSSWQSAVSATVGTQDTWLDGYGIIAYGLVPLGFIPLAAGFIASPRANRFVESVFTAPVERRHWLVAKGPGAADARSGYYVALVPMLLVYIHQVGFPFLLGRFLLWTPGIMIASIAIGTLIGVLFIGRSVAAPSGGRHGRTARLCRFGAASGIDGGARQRRDAFGPHRAGESGGAAQERAGFHACGGQHSGHDRR